MAAFQKMLPIRVSEKMYGELQNEADRLHIPVSHVARYILATALADGRGRLAVVRDDERETAAESE